MDVITCVSSPDPSATLTVSPSPPAPPRTEAEQIVKLTQDLAWAEWKIRALEERLRLEMIRKYGPKSEKLNDTQLLLLELEPGVSAAEVEAESHREPLPPATGVRSQAIPETKGSFDPANQRENYRGPNSARCATRICGAT
jgi:Transposase C of IS166 homeodomain